MPFTIKNAVDAGRKGGLAVKDPTVIRNKQINLRVSHAEAEMIDGVAVVNGLSRTELIVRAVKEFGRCKYRTGVWKCECGGIDRCSFFT